MSNVPPPPISKQILIKSASHFFPFYLSIITGILVLLFSGCNKAISINEKLNQIETLPNQPLTNREEMFLQAFSKKRAELNGSDWKRNDSLSALLRDNLLIKMSKAVSHLDTLQVLNEHKKQVIQIFPQVASRLKFNNLNDDINLLEEGNLYYPPGLGELIPLGSNKFRYKWTVVENLFSLWRLRSECEFTLLPVGAITSVGVYHIGNVSHIDDFLEGFHFGIDWDRSANTSLNYAFEYSSYSPPADIWKNCLQDNVRGRLRYFSRIIYTVDIDKQMDACF